LKAAAVSDSSTMLYLRNIESVRCPETFIAVVLSTPERIRLRAPAEVVEEPARRECGGLQRATPQITERPHHPARTWKIRGQSRRRACTLRSMIASASPSKPKERPFAFFVMLPGMHLLDMDILVRQDASRIPAPLARADQHPVAVYLAHLSPGSRRAMRQVLDVVASLVSSGRANAENVPWAALGYQHPQAIRAALQERYAPATAN
jgi:hypothetical protein